MKNKLTKEDIKQIMSKYREGLGLVEISEGYVHSQSVINGIICYYNQRQNKVSSLLSEYYKGIIDEIREVEKDMIEPKSISHYECTILFGLIKLTFKPVV